MVRRNAAVEAEVESVAAPPEEPAAPDVIVQFGAGDSDKLWRVDRSFSLDVKFIQLAPPVHISVGAVVRLKRETAEELFLANKIRPLTLGRRFEVLRNFNVVDPATGGYIFLDANDKIELEYDEAVKYLRQKLVREVDDES